MEGLSGSTMGGRAGGVAVRDRAVAQPGFNRWLVPPAALAVHLCIGMVYGLSVFWLPMTRLLGVTEPVTCGPEVGLVEALTVNGCDWRVSDVSWTFTIAIVVLGLSAALWGGWVGRAGPRKAGILAALCWSGGLLVGALGIKLHQLWLLWLGVGVLGGAGLGIGYISPVSTLVKWFPDRRGMATGMAIMGFGGGALIGAPLADLLMNLFQSRETTGVWECMATLAAIYLVVMLAGAFSYRVPPAGWRLEGWRPSRRADAAITGQDVDLKDAHKTLAFWMLWLVLCLNVSAGIGLLSFASSSLQELFGGALIGLPGTGFTSLSEDQLRAVAAVGAGFVGLLSLFNIAGRFAWASLSDVIGRQLTYSIFFAVGAALYVAQPTVGNGGNLALFVLLSCAIVSLYGGGFATIPAYLSDIFGTRFIAAIHGRLLTAWSVAAVFGPAFVTWVRNAQIQAGMTSAAAYAYTLYALAGLLVLGAVANLLVRPLADRWFMPETRLGAVPGSFVTAAAQGAPGTGTGGLDAKVAVAWAAVAVPAAWGVWVTLSKTAVLFH